MEIYSVTKEAREILKRKKPKAFYIKIKDGKLIIRLATRIRRPYHTRESWGIFIVFGKGLDYTRYY